MDIVNFLTENQQIFLLIVALMSLFIGSFLNVVIYRLPRMMEQSWSEECRIYLGLKPHTDTERFNLCLPFSHCPQCKKNIRPWHNIPVLSYIWLQGRCAYCRARIAARYPFVEILTCVMSTYVAWRFGLTWSLLPALLFTWILVSLTFIDLDFHLLPDQLTLTLLWLGLLTSLFAFFCDSHQAIIGAVVGYLVFAITQWLFKLMTGKTGMGQGDFKLLAAMGGFLGWEQLPLIVLLASLSGVVITFTHMLVKRQYKSVPLPFGPYLAVAGWIALLWGNEIMHYYFQLSYLRY